MKANPLHAYKKYLWGCGCSLLIASLCLMLVFQLDKSRSIEYEPLALQVYISFYSSVATIYVMSCLLWAYFYSLFGQSRQALDIVIDMGLIAIGKYLPGKIWGVALRGSLSKNQIKFDKSRILISILEQGFSLIIGCLTVAALSLAIHLGFSWMSALTFFSIALISSTLLLPLLKVALGYMKKIPTDLILPSLTHRLVLGIGYTCLWLFSAAPIIYLMRSSLSLSTHDTIAVSAAFLGSMIAGWLALFAPSGIGVRESVFVLLAPDFLTWHEGLYWVTLHRGLFTLFDVSYGLLTLGLIAARSHHFSMR